MRIRDCEMFLLNEDSSLIQAMKRLDESARKVLFVMRDGQFQATLTDGDIRRWILKNGDLTASVSQMANYRPYSVHEAQADQAYQLLEQYRIDAIPVLDSERHVVGVYVRDGKVVAKPVEPLNVPVVIMAGGIGSRLYPYTKILPKPLIPIGELPISELIINRFYEQGCRQFYMILNYKKNMIKAYYNEIAKDYALEMVDEPAALGTGGGLSLLRGRLNETFIFTNCDTIISETLSKALRNHREQGNMITMVCSMKNYVIPYGIIHLDEQGCIADMQEKPQLPFLINTGTYIVEPAVLERIPPDTVITFPEIIQQCMDAGYKVSIYPVGEDSWFDMGQISEMEAMKQKLGIYE